MAEKTTKTTKTPAAGPTVQIRIDAEVRAVLDQIAAEVDAEFPGLSKSLSTSALARMAVVRAKKPAA